MPMEINESVLVQFKRDICEPLEAASVPSNAISTMFHILSSYRDSGRLICPIGSMIDDGSRCFRPEIVTQCSDHWISALKQCLCRAQVPTKDADSYATEVVSALLGSVFLLELTDDYEIFSQTLTIQEDYIIGILSVHHSNTGRIYVSPTKIH